MTMRILSTKAVTATLAACAMATIPFVSANAQTLKFVSWQVDEAGTGDWWRNAIARFEAEHPGVTIEFTKVDRGAYADTMTTLFAGGPAASHHAPCIVRIPELCREWLDGKPGSLAGEGRYRPDWLGPDRALAYGMAKQPASCCSILAS